MGKNTLSYCHIKVDNFKALKEEPRDRRTYSIYNMEHVSAICETADNVK